MTSLSLDSPCRECHYPYRSYTHSYRDTGPAPSLRQAPGHDTDHPIMVIVAHCCICTAQRRHLLFHMATTTDTVPCSPGLHSPWLCNTSLSNIGHSIALKAQYQVSYAPRYSRTCCPRKWDLLLYRMKLLGLARAGGGGEVGVQEQRLFPLSLSSIKCLSLLM
jgi:hypothetical protein